LWCKLYCQILKVMTSHAQSVTVCVCCRCEPLQGEWVHETGNGGCAVQQWRGHCAQRSLSWVWEKQPGLCELSCIRAWPSASLINFSPKLLSCDFHSQFLACSRNRYVTEVSPSSTLCCVMYNAYAVLLQLLCLMEFVQVLWAYWTLPAIDIMCHMTHSQFALDSVCHLTHSQTGTQREMLCRTSQWMSVGRCT